MEKDIVEAYIKHYCKECQNKDTDLCHIAVASIKEARLAKCVWYCNNINRKHKTK